MNILVIKQTSLGDVLHATGHLRAIKENFPSSRLTLLTAPASADICRHNPWVDEVILFDNRAIVRQWRRPKAAAKILAAALRQVRARPFDLAFDLQGLAKSALFLYAARRAAGGEKYIKGRWLGLSGFRNPRLHAIAEMDGVLRRARLAVGDTAMEFFTAAGERRHIDALLARINPANKPLLLFSPFSRWRSKDWPLARYVEIAAWVARRFRGQFCMAFTGQAATRDAIERAIAPVNAGLGGLGEWGEIEGGKFAGLGEPISRPNSRPSRQSTCRQPDSADFASQQPIHQADSADFASQQPIHQADSADFASQQPIHQADSAKFASQSTNQQPNLANLAGQLSLPQFAELTGRARLLLSGDSFPMHLACAQKTPLIALFGPTQASKTGPVGPHCRVIRAPNCHACDRPACRRHCLARLPTEVVRAALLAEFDGG